MSFSFGPFFTCFIITFFLTGYLHIISHRNTFFSKRKIRFFNIMDMKSKATFARIIAIQNVQKSARDERPEKLNVFLSELLREFRKRETTLEVCACGVLLVALTSDSIFYSCDLSYEMRTWEMLLENTFNENKLSFFIAKRSSCYLGINFRIALHDIF